MPRAIFQGSNESKGQANLYQDQGQGQEIRR